MHLKIISKGCKPNKIWVDQGGEFYNKLFMRYFRINNIEMYSTFNEGKLVVAERVIRTMTVISKNIYFDVLGHIIEKYTNGVHKMKLIDVTSDSYAEYNQASNEKDPKFKVGGHIRISKYKSIFAKGYTQNWLEEVFIVSKIKNTVPRTYVISDLNDEEIDGTCFEKELQKTNQKEFRIKKIKEQLIN